MPLPAYADAIAPGIALAQALGRWGNWFNQELYGRETTLPWGLEIKKTLPSGEVVTGIYHPTFLYESLWCVGVAALVIWADKRFTLGHGRAFALYVAAYTVGRFWIEWLRIDDAHHVLGLRLNDWVAIFVFLGAVAYFVIVGKKHPGREDPASIDPMAEADERAAASADLTADESDGTSGDKSGDKSDEKPDEKPGGKAQDALAEKLDKLEKDARNPA